MNDQPIDAVVVRENNAVATSRDNAMNVADIIAQVKLIQEVMGKVMQEGEHYGQIPGCGTRKTLLQPGAQKLTMTFRLAPEYQIQETNYDKGHKEYRVICTLKSISSGAFVGQGVGCCSTLESKYRWKGGARKCPECGKEAIIKGKAEFGGGWICFTKKNGCGAKWGDNDLAIVGQSVDRVEHDSPADFYNTVLKMAKKRAFVDATITATAASDIFTQDIGDDDAPADAAEPPKRPPDRPEPAKPSTPPQTPKAAQAPKEAAATPQGKTGGTEAEWARFLGACKARLLTLIRPEDEWAWWYYGTQQNWILTTESLAETSIDKMFEGFNRKNHKESAKFIMEKHRTAVTALLANCPPEFLLEVESGMVRMPRTPDPEHPPQDSEFNRKPVEDGPVESPKDYAKKGRPNGCPICASTAIKKHEDLIGVSWCQSCGTAWQDGDPKREAYEEHEFMWAKLPFAPKAEEKKKYKGMTLGQLSRIDSKYWFGIVMNFTAEPFQGRPPSAESVAFGEACAAARKHLDEAKAAEAGGTAKESGPGAPGEDDVPFI